MKHYATGYFLHTYERRCVAVGNEDALAPVAYVVRQLGTLTVAPLTGAPCGLLLGLLFCSGEPYSV